jgi:3',5'-cyclic AMP phosphodiesterase CpdA
MPANGTYRIAHLSDIHFGATFDPSLWKYLNSVLRHVEPRMIAVTGDVVDHGGLFMLLLARNQLEELARGCDACLRVIPGNHDVGLWGNVGGWPLSTHFGIAFSGIPTGTKKCVLLDAVRRFLPTYMRYRGWRRYLRWPLRVVATIVLFVLRATVWLFAPGASGLPVVVKRPATEPGHHPSEPFLAYLNSNDASFLATGSVDVTHLGDLQAHIADMSESMKTALAPRIALMHHHALPIPYSDVKEGLTSFEPFLVLRNAGTVLKELTRNDFDIVLHGHKHYSSFMRLGYTNQLDVEGELAVIAAGSAGVTHSEAGRNSINVVDLDSNGYMLYVPIYYGGGQSVSSLAQLLARATPIHPVGMLKRRAFRRAFEVQGRECARLERVVAIDAWGSAQATQRVIGFRVGGTTAVQTRTINFGVSLGRMHPDACTLDDESIRQGFRLEKREGEPTDALHCVVHLNRTIGSASQPVSYGIDYRSINTFVMSGWEAKLLGRENDWISVLVRFPMRELKLTVKLPEGITDLRPKVAVRRHVRYPDLQLDADGDLTQTGTRADYEVDSAMTEHEQANLIETLPGMWTLTVEYPLVGFQYSIEWVLRIRPDQWDERRAGEAAELRRTLLRAAGTVGTSSPAPVMHVIDEGLNAMLTYLKRAYGSRTRADEAMRLALFVFDDEKRELRRIAEVGDEPPRQLVPFGIPMGQGVAYRAFRRTSFQLYRCPTLTGGLSDGAYLYWPPGDAPNVDYAVLAAFPMLLPLPQDGGEPESAERVLPPQEAIGVYSIASDALDSGLLSLSSDPARPRPAAEEEWKRLTLLADAVTRQFQAALEAHPSA